MTRTGHPRRDNPQPPLATILDRLLQPCPPTAQRREVESPPGNRATEIGDVPLEFDAGNDSCDGRRGRPSPPSVSTRSTVSASDDWTIGAVEPSTAPTLGAPIAGSFHVGNDQPDRLGRFFDEDVLTNDDHISILTAPPQKVDQFATTSSSTGDTGTAPVDDAVLRRSRAVRAGSNDVVGARPRPDLQHTLDAATGSRQSANSPHHQSRQYRSRTQPS